MNHIDHWSLTPDFSVSDPSDSNFHLFPLRFGSSLFSISQKMHPNDGGKNWQGEARLDGGGVRGWWGFRERYIWLSPTPQHCRLTQIHFSLHLAPLLTFFLDFLTIFLDFLTFFFDFLTIFLDFLNFFWISWHFLDFLTFFLDFLTIFLDFLTIFLDLSTILFLFLNQKELDFVISGSPRHRSIVALPWSIFHCTLHLSRTFFGFLLFLVLKFFGGISRYFSLHLAPSFHLLLQDIY